MSGLRNSADKIDDPENNKLRTHVASGLKCYARQIKKNWKRCLTIGFCLLTVYTLSALFKSQISDTPNANIRSYQHVTQHGNPTEPPGIQLQGMRVFADRTYSPAKENNNITADKFNHRFSSYEPKEFWNHVNSLVSDVELYPRHFDVNIVLNKLVVSRITAVRRLIQGTSYKWLLELEGQKKVVFKAQLVSATEEKQRCNSGHEQGAYEVAAFHFLRLMGSRTTPFVAGRKIHIASEIMPLAPREIRETIEIHENGTACIIHRCLRCEKKSRFCFLDGAVSGSMSLWIDQAIGVTFPSKNGITYHYSGLVKNSSLVLNDQECHPLNDVVRAMPLYNVTRYYLDLLDMVIFDYVMGNMDRKHAYIVDDNNKPIFTIHLDHGLAFCKRDDEVGTLLRALNCCRMRRRTIEVLERILPTLKSDFRAQTHQDQLYPLLTEFQLDTVLGKMKNVLGQVDRCLQVVPESIMYLDVE